MINEIKKEIEDRQISRLCHFVRTNKLLHILNNEEGIKAVNYIDQDVLVQNDTQRLDGRKDFINCSIQFPNWWYLKRIKDNNPIFTDWAIIFIDPIVATLESTEFCAVNAAKRYGAYIKKGYSAFSEIFDARVDGFLRPQQMLSNAATNDQAEVLVYESIPRKYITGVAFMDKEVARQKVVEWQVLGITDIEVFIAPELFLTSTSSKIRQGQEPSIEEYMEDKDETD